MTNHSITPPPKLAARWKDKWFDAKIKHINLEDYILAQAAQWGADQELEACCEWLQHDYPNIGANALRAARRPKPPSLKEQALEGLTRLVSTGEFFSNQMKDLDTIRRALEQLDD